MTICLYSICLICAYFDSLQLFYSLKSVGNLGLAAPLFVPLLTHFMVSQSSLPELRLAAIHAFRRYPCSVDVSPNLNQSTVSQKLFFPLRALISSKGEEVSVSPTSVADSSFLPPESCAVAAVSLLPGGSRGQNRCIPAAHAMPRSGRVRSGEDDSEERDLQPRCQQLKLLRSFVLQSTEIYVGKRVLSVETLHWGSRCYHSLGVVWLRGHFFY